MLRGLLLRFVEWRNKRNWLSEMRKLKRELGASPSAKQMDQIIANGYEQFVERNRDVIEEELELERQLREIGRMKKELFKK
jgi:hypothetical protein